MLVAVLSAVVLLLVVAAPALAGRDYYEVLGVPRDAHDRTFACFSSALSLSICVWHRSLSLGWWVSIGARLDLFPSSRTVPMANHNSA